MSVFKTKAFLWNPIKDRPPRYTYIRSGFRYYWLEVYEDEGYGVSVQYMHKDELPDEVKEFIAKEEEK